MSTHTLSKFQRALMRKPAQNFTQGITTFQGETINKELFFQQYENYFQAMKKYLDVELLESNENYPDAQYVEDPVIIFRDTAFLCKSNQKSRDGEYVSLLPHLKGLKQVELLGNLDGGDVLFCSDRVLVGISNRSNLEGANSLKEAIHSIDSTIKVDFVSFEGVLHLKSGLTELYPGVLVLSETLKTDYNFKEWAKVHILPKEEDFGVNVLPINDVIFISSHCPILFKLAKEHYSEDKIVVLDMSENYKMDGALTCLSLRY
jgi:dimethylargininase